MANKKPLKILVCHNSYKNTSGEDLVIAADIQILKEGGADVIEYARSNKEIDSFGFAEKVSFFPNALYSRRTSKEIKNLCERAKPDVALVQNVFPLISPSVYHALYDCGVPIVQLVYNYRLICPNAILYTNGSICERCIGGNYAHAIKHRCFRESRTLSALYATSLHLHRNWYALEKMITAFVTPDEFLQTKLEQGGFPRERMFAILNPFDVQKYSPNFENSGYFVYFGRVVREKGIFTLLAAMQQLKETKLVVIGGGEAEQEARTFAANNNLNNVSFFGPRYGSELIEVLRGAIAIIVPTEWYDNSPLVVHQAFALGKPVIASDIDGISEIVEHEKHGFLFAPGDSSMLASRMKQLKNDGKLCQELGRNCRAKAEADFTANRRFEELMKVVHFARANMNSK